MKLGIPKESFENENRVAITPESVKKLVKSGFSVCVEKNAGLRAGFVDKDYSDAGAELTDLVTVFSSDIVLKVRPPVAAEADKMRDGTSLFAIMDGLNQAPLIEILKKKKITSFAMEFIPRITLAQSMDVLSSMATIAGYKAVLLAANHFERLMPMLMTAAGTIPPARVLILGAGVAGLQAIATARRLGAIVEAFDTRPEVKEQVESLGAKFVEMEHDANASDDQGYAKEMSAEFIRKEMELIGKHLSKSDICITTAQVFGKKAPILIQKHMVENMKPGSVIVDLAVEQGGNCELSKPGVTDHGGVTIIGPVNIAGQMSSDASRMYSKNIENLLVYLQNKETKQVEFKPEDEIVKRSLITRDGEMVSEIIRNFSGR